MKFLSTTALAALAFVSASPIARDVPDGVVAIPVARKPATAGSHSRIKRRATSSTVPERLSNQVYQYIASFDLGTPGQTVQAALDTGSSDLWLFNGDTGKSGSFSPSSSSSYRLIQKDGFSINYVSGSAVGDWGSDTISLGGTKVDNFNFATVDASGASEVGDLGVFGIARISDEAYSSNYDNFPVRLKKAGYISKLAYSLFLDDINAETGTILFGGYDAHKYHGTLKYIPFTSEDALEVAYSVAGQDGKAILDSGTSLTYLPSETFHAVVSQQGWDLQFDDMYGYYLASAPTGSGLKYSFGSIDITVPNNELFMQQDGKYVLTILPTDYSGGYVLLGDSFLRSAYVVYDLEDNVAALAQAAFTDSSRIVAITGPGIPGTSKA